MTISKELLKNAVQNMFAQDKVSNDLNDEAQTYIDTINDKDWLEIPFSSWNQAGSSGFTFDDVNRLATNASGLVKYLVSSNLAISGFKIKGFKLVGTTQAVEYQYSFDGTNWYAIAEWNVCEEISASSTPSFYVRIKTNDNVISKIILFKESLN